MRLEFTRDAQSDLDEIFDYLALNAGVSIADKVIDQLMHSMELCREQPLMGTRRPDFDSRGLEIRSLAIGSFVAFTTLHKDCLFVVRVIHGSMDIGPSAFGSVGEIA